ncbi:MAG: helix-turn-helix transcriptional regulator [Comamonadaceae bacterium]|nr:MAG: helix-turn-helix transcriptional regulator [Comamonadaceae bacterium]
MLDELRPHLARSALISCRLELERLNASLTGIEAIGYPAAVIGNGGRIIATNSSFEGLDSLVIATASGRFAIRNKGANDAMQTELDKLSRRYSTARSVAVPGDNENAPVVFHLVPIRGRAHDLFASAEAFLIATLASRPKAPPFEVLNTLFDLTPAEARVARLLTSGLSAVEIAKVGKVSTETIRGQIKSLLRKSGMHRQSDLILFLAGIGLRNSP